MRINEPPIPDLSAEISRKDIGTQQARREGSSPSHRLMVFLCHSSADKPAVRTLYEKLVTQSIDTWLDEENLLPGEDWQREIPRAVKNADVVIVCLSKQSVNKQGYLQKEIRFALDAADEKPEGTIFLIPARLEECVVPERLEKWQWVNLYEENGFERLMRALKKRSAAIGIDK